MSERKLKVVRHSGPQTEKPPQRCLPFGKHRLSHSRETLELDVHGGPGSVSAGTIAPAPGSRTPAACGPTAGPGARPTGTGSRGSTEATAIKVPGWWHQVPKSSQDVETVPTASLAHSLTFFPLYQQLPRGVQEPPCLPWVRSGHPTARPRRLKHS